MNAARRLLRALVVERQLRPASRRAGRTGRSSRTGVALLIVVSLLALMTVLTTEIVHKAGVRIRMAANQRDEAMAEALAYGGVQFYRLILIAGKQVDDNPMFQQLMQYVPMPVNQLWQVVPALSTSVLRLVLVTDGDEDDLEAAAKRGGLTEEQREESREAAQTSLKKAFLDFDGDFSVKCEAEDSRIFVGNITAVTLQELAADVNLAPLWGMMTSEAGREFLRETDYEPEELIANLGDWTDMDDNRMFLGGRESQVYQSLDDPYVPKNQPFSSLDEIRLVDGWHRDDVWDRFGSNLTIFPVGGIGKVNINTASPAVLMGLMAHFATPRPSDDQLMQAVGVFMSLRSLPPIEGGQLLREPSQFTGVVRSLLPGYTIDDRLTTAVSTKSTVFRVTSVGTVGDAKAEIEAVFDFTRSRIGKVASWRIR